MGKIIPKKTPMREQPPVERARNYDEVPYGYSEQEAIQEAQRCLQCKKPTCMQGCPVEIDIPGFIKFLSEGDFQGAINRLKEKNVLPAVCGRVCPQEDQCEKYCVLAKKYEPVAIGRLERFAADWEMRQGEASVPSIPSSTGKKVAVIGSGPGGLTVAGDLIKCGHGVTIFEALHKPGGVLVYGIPEFRLPKAIVYREVDYLVKCGVQLVLDFIVGKTATIDQLLEDFDAVYIGTGAGLPWFMNIPGENLNGVYSANEYLTRANLMKAYLFPEYDTPIIRSKKIAVLGGGNVAMDCARTALRLGADEVHIVYRRSRKEMPAREEEIHHAEQEGVIFDLLTTPVRHIGDENNWVKEMECIRMRLG
jgi:glutamate synthase (NADPH/NADH) small chain